MSVVRNADLKKVKFGNSDMMVTEACVGTMTWGSFNDKEEQAYEQLDKAIEMGVNFIDTAELYPVAFNYGKTTEEWMGRWLSDRTAKGNFKREDIYLATKVNPSMLGGQPEGEAPTPHGYEADIVERSCRQSIARLQCEYIDLYQLHWPSRDTPIFGCGFFYPGEGKNRPMPAATPLKAGDAGVELFERQVAAVKKLFDLKLIKHWGLSNENAFGITMFCMAADKLGCPRPVSCQNDFSMLNRTYEADTWEAAYRFGVVGMPYGVLAAGVLTGKYHEGTQWNKKAEADRPVAECRMRKTPDFQPRYGMPMAMKATEEYIKLAEKYDLTPSELALAWGKQRDCNAVVITGSCTVKQIEECINACKIELPEEILTAVDIIHEQYRHPSIFLHDKAVTMEAKWLGDAPVSAKGSA
mmetsp:Transcript_688/g.2181  ORF Transcript_688/g.2181 Transcript_688/m.2181 type:complete len:412 (-) Transcript_688:167-1402(-)